jgi:phosphatidylserine decarboxylase
MNLIPALRRLAGSEDLNFLLTNRVPRIALTHAIGWWSRIRHPWVRDLSLAVWKPVQRPGPERGQRAALRQPARLLHPRTAPRRAAGGPAPGDVTSPSDGIVGACGHIETVNGEPQVFQAKGFPYRLAELLGDSVHTSELCRELEGGRYVTLRLTSAMYHRFHAPCDARLEHVTYISGDTWNVNPIALQRVERLFCRNERAVLHLRQSDGTRLLLVPVAAILVASMRLHALDVPLNLRYRGANELPCDAACAKGQELGWFEHGSTVLVFAPPGHTLAPGLSSGDIVRMGQPLLTRTGSAPSAGCQLSLTESSSKAGR